MLDVNDPAQVQTPAAVHECLANLCAEFHQWQDAVLAEPACQLGERLKTIAGVLIELCESNIDQVLGELFLTK